MEREVFDVSAVRCADYRPERVYAALRQSLDAVDGLAWLKPGMKVAVKANLVAACKKEAAATVHPTVLAQLTRILLEAGAGQVVIGDSPGGLFNEVNLRHVYDVTGMEEARQAGAVLNDDFREKAGSFPEAAVLKSFHYTAWLDSADAVIDVCKLKSHGMMGFSGAAKNMFGVIPGTQKPEYHFRFPELEKFTEMLLDLDTFFHPVLCIADGVVGMEGNGPTQGKPKQIGVLAASASPHALDLVCAELLGMHPQEVPTLAAAQRRGLIPQTARELRVDGDMDALRVTDFKTIAVRHDLTFRDAAGGRLLGELFSRVVGKALSSRPEVTAKECIGCGKCAAICPAGAITMQDRLPQIDREKCIRCFCCQEFCPKGAMKVHRTWLAKLLTK